MSDDAAIDVMEALHSCRCCLRRAPDKDLKTPYTHLGNTEIYLVMIKECFNIRLNEGGEECGICSACVGRLQDASAFKLQVQRCQAELQARLERALQAIDEETAVKPETTEGTTTVDSCEESPVKDEAGGEGGTSQDLVLQASCGSPHQSRGGGLRDHTYAATEYPPAAVARAGGARSVSARAREQLGMACSVRLERLRGDVAPHASQTWRATSRRGPRPAGSNVHTCGTCKNQFAYRSALIRHIRKHTGQVPYTCDVTSKTFTDSSHLRSHQRIHTENKRYTCHICKRQFTQKGHLSRHIRTHTGERPYFCDVCRKTFADSSVLRRHQRIHTGDKRYACNVCKKQFTLKGNLIRHIRTHTGERPYSCNVCSKTFTQISSLKTHQQRHAGHNPYARVICKK